MNENYINAMWLLWAALDTFSCMAFSWFISNLFKFDVQSVLSVGKVLIFLAVFEYVSWLLEMLAIFVSVNTGQGKNSSLLFIILEKCL